MCARVEYVCVRVLGMSVCAIIAVVSEVFNPIVGTDELITLPG